jgi:hypothetical protein
VRSEPRTARSLPWPGVSRGAVTGTPICWDVIAVRFQWAALTPAVIWRGARRTWFSIAAADAGTAHVSHCYGLKQPKSHGWGACQLSPTVTQCYVAFLPAASGGVSCLVKGEMGGTGACHGPLLFRPVPLA